MRKNLEKKYLLLVESSLCSSINQNEDKFYQIQSQIFENKTYHFVNNLKIVN